MTTEANKQLVRRIYGDIVNAGRLDLYADLLAEDIIDHEGFPDTGRGCETYKQSLTVLRSAFPDLRMDVEDMVAEGDRVVTRLTLRGTHQGQYLGLAPTGRFVTTGSIDILRLAGGKAVERWAETDTLGLLQQLGAISEAVGGGQ